MGVTDYFSPISPLLESDGSYHLVIPFFDQYGLEKFRWSKSIALMLLSAFFDPEKLYISGDPENENSTSYAAKSVLNIL